MPYEIGFVYVLRNPAMPGMVKIGFTDQLTEDRANKLYNTSVPYPFDILFRAVTNQPYEVEQEAHRVLEPDRVSKTREFFRTPPEIAIETVRRCVWQVNGIHCWQPSTTHYIRSRDRVVLPLEEGEAFALIARQDLFSGSAEVVDCWQAHSNGDLLELYGTDRPGSVAGLKDGDPGGDSDPVPYLDRAGDVVNGTLVGRERLVPGDRLLWFSEHDDATSCGSTLFEAIDYCQVVCRTWSPCFSSEGFPILLNHLTHDLPSSMVKPVREALALPAPRSWAPRNPDDSESWAPVATDPQPAEYWLPQLKLRQRKR